MGDYFDIGFMEVDMASVMTWEYRVVFGGNVQVMGRCDTLAQAKKEAQRCGATSINGWPDKRGRIVKYAMVGGNWKRLGAF